MRPIRVGSRSYKGEVSAMGIWDNPVLRDDTPAEKETAEQRRHRKGVLDLLHAYRSGEIKTADETAALIEAKFRQMYKIERAAR